jgi:predicted SAM-dependent methyltransferase
MDLEEYVRFLRRSGHAAPTDSPLRRLVKALLPAPLRGGLKCRLTRAAEPYSRIRARRLAARAGPLRIHLGSGVSPKPGWVNVDLVGAKADLWWDVTRSLPFRDHQVDAVFHEHLLEHLSLEQGLALIRECRRVLKEDGTLRIVVPDCQGYLVSYAEGGTFLEEAKPGRPTSLLAASEVFLRHGHRSAYDFETLSLLCREAGFAGVERSSYGGGRLQPCPDSEHRRWESLYVEAVKRSREWGAPLERGGGGVNGGRREGAGAGRAIRRTWHDR